MARRTRSLSTDDSAEDQPTGVTLDAMMAEVTQKMGGGVMVRSPRHTVPLIPTGSFPLDLSLGGGLPEGFISQYFGWEGCLAADTPLKYIVVDDATGSVRDCKGGTIANLFRRFHGLPNPGKGRPASSKPCTYYAVSVNDEDCIFRNEIADVVYSGVRPVFTLLTALGKSLTATADHKIYTGDRYVPLGDLSPGDTVMVHDNVHRAGRDSSPGKYAYASVKWYHRGSPHLVGGQYEYYRPAVHRLVYEASLNGWTYDDYVAYLNSGAEVLPEGFRVIPDGVHVHHVDEDKRNNAIENLEPIDPREHAQVHALDRHNNLRFVAVPDEVVSITPAGEAETYDVKCFVPYNNFVAAGVVTHNSGKTTMAIRAAVEAQRKYPDRRIVFVDFERTFDPLWAERHGLDMDRVYLITPDTAEQGIDLIVAAHKANEASMIIVDSIPAMMPGVLLDRSAEDATVGLRAQLVSLLLTKLLGGRSNHRVYAYPPPTIILINQFRSKIGVVFGDPRSLTGGNFLQYAASCSVEFKKKENIGRSPVTGIELVLSNTISYTVAKLKGAKAEKKGQFDMILDNGHPWGTGALDDWGGFMSTAKALHFLTGGGSAQGMVGLEGTYRKRDAIRDHLLANPEENARVRARMLMTYRSLAGLPAAPSDNYLSRHMCGGDDANLVSTQIEENWGIVGPGAEPETGESPSE